MCDCKCKCAKAKTERKLARYFDILHIPSGDYIYDVPERKLSETVEELISQGNLLEDLKITEEIAVKRGWAIVD
jgi:hypothetical protein